MDSVMAVDVMDPRSLLITFGLAGVLVILFAETGLLVGFFLPGDSLLFVTGIAAAGELTGTSLPLGWLLIGAPLAAIGGSQLGHYWGASLGRRLFDRPQSRFYQPANVDRAEAFLTRFGVGRALVLARFVGVVRTFINPVAGVLHVPAKRFFLWNVVGALLWTDGIILTGYLIGDAIPDIDTYLLPIVAVIMAVSLIPLVLGLMKGKAAPPAVDDEHIPALRDALASDTSQPVPLLTIPEARAALHLLNTLTTTDPPTPATHLARTLTTRLAPRLPAPPETEDEQAQPTAPRPKNPQSN